MKKNKLLLTIVLFLSLFLMMGGIRAENTASSAAKQEVESNGKSVGMYCYYSGQDYSYSNIVIAVAIASDKSIAYGAQVVAGNSTGDSNYNTTFAINNWKKDDENWDPPSGKNAPNFSAYDYVKQNDKCPEYIYRHYWENGNKYYWYLSDEQSKYIKNGVFYNNPSSNDYQFQQSTEEEVDSLFKNLDSVGDWNSTCTYVPSHTLDVTDELNITFAYRNSEKKVTGFIGTWAKGTYDNDLLLMDTIDEISSSMFSKGYFTCPCAFRACMAADDDPEDFGWQWTHYVVGAFSSRYFMSLMPGRNYYDSIGKRTYYFKNAEDDDDECQMYNLKNSLSCSTISCDFVDIDNLRTMYNSTSKNEYLEQKSKTLSFCNSVLKYTNYAVSISGKIETDACVLKCLSINDEIKRIEGTSVNSSKCGLSGRILIWIGNIIKWVKYLIPVVIIILSILDFIKAIASDKDDEMKKAQKKFITRLIAAVLIFITPIIIEFILSKIGFNANGCGIIDL